MKMRNFLLVSVLCLCLRSHASAEEITLDSVPPVVVKTMPQAGANHVDPKTKEIRVVFSKKMTTDSWSWVQMSKETFPEVTQKPKFLKDGKTCVLGVKLKPGTTYAIWFNSGKHNLFKDSDGQSAVPYLLVFETKK